MSPTQTTTLNVRGMSCGSCVNHVGKALRALSGVRAVDVKLDEAKAVIEHDVQGPSVAAMLEAVRAEGYEADAAR